jgi:hypothetical protein
MYSVTTVSVTTVLVHRLTPSKGSNHVVRGCWAARIQPVQDRLPDEDELALLYKVIAVGAGASVKVTTTGSGGAVVFV